MRALLPPSSYLRPYILLATLLVLLALLPEQMQQWLRYDRSALAAGQYWRVISGHLLHSNHWHLLMNLAGLLLVMLLHGSYFRARYLMLQWVIFACIISGLLYFCSPDMQIYVGLSALLHAMLTLGAVKDILVKQRTGMLLLAGMLAKVAWEQWQGPDAQLGQLINASVAIDAHMYGVISGLLLAVWLLLAKRSAKP